MITGLHHINIIVPPHTLPSALEFYSRTLGLTARPVPAAQLERLAWFDIGGSGQQVHVAFGREDVDFTDAARKATRHPCFRVESVEKLSELQERVWEHFVEGKDNQDRDGTVEGGDEKVKRRLGAPMDCDEPGKENSGAKGPEYPTRFFARDYAGNRLEFTV